MKIKDLLKELSVFNEEDEIIACFCDDFHDDKPDVEYDCDFTVEFDGIPYLDLKVIAKYGNVD